MLARETKGERPISLHIMVYLHLEQDGLSLTKLRRGAQGVGCGRWNRERSLHIDGRQEWGPHRSWRRRRSKGTVTSSCRKRGTA